MAVFTPLSCDQIQLFWAGYGREPLAEIEPIAEGVQNTNYLLVTRQGERFVLTLAEKWVQPEALAFCMKAMRHLAGRGYFCPSPLHPEPQELAGKPALIVNFLTGRAVFAPSTRQIESAGQALAQMHVLMSDFDATFSNPLGEPIWSDWALRLAEPASSLVALSQRLSGVWPTSLPRGFIHADYFPDNVFFDGDQVCGVIDFYFGATDFLAFDVAIALSAWCFSDSHELSQDAVAAFLRGYQSVRPLLEAEKEALPVLCQGAALRFTLSRLEDNKQAAIGQIYTPKDPSIYLSRLRSFEQASQDFWHQVLS